MRLPPLCHEENSHPQSAQCFGASSRQNTGGGGYPPRRQKRAPVSIPPAPALHSRPHLHLIPARPAIASTIPVYPAIRNQDDILVVDTHLRPTWTKHLIAEIRRITV